MYKNEFGFDSLQWLMCHKIKTNENFMDAVENTSE